MIDKNKFFTFKVSHLSDFSGPTKISSRIDKRDTEPKNYMCQSITYKLQNCSVRSSMWVGYCNDIAMQCNIKMKYNNVE